MDRKERGPGEPGRSPERAPDRWGFTKEQAELRRPVRLTTVSDEMEAGVVQSLLDSCGIPSRRRSIGVGAFMGVVLGSNRYTLEIDVAEEDLATAQDLLAARPLSNESAQALVASGDAEPAEVPAEAPAEAHEEDGSTKDAGAAEDPVADLYGQEEDEDPVDEQGRNRRRGSPSGGRLPNALDGLRIGFLVAGILLLLVCVAIAFLN